ncbi:MAG TPA: patatin-like phospholipase family protein [Stellaceae bacterium]|nr:patatin-like phospholipase family protein [Stellaceae bacterium]
MDEQPQSKTRTALARLPFECVALLLQGGGALGAYQGGVYQALSEAGIHPNWVAGISIGAFNSAIIAGNPPETRVDTLRRFWEGLTARPGWDLTGALGAMLVKGNDARQLVNQMSASAALLGGVPGFFKPRLPPPWLQPPGSLDATSYYDTAPLKATLERLVDFDRINAGAPRFSVGAVNVRSGNFVYFDTTTHVIRPEHVLASGALPPSFPAIEIEGEHYWDGGLVSNTPLQWVLQYGPRQDTLAFQIDLWSARGAFPDNMIEVATRQKEIQYSSRTRENTDRFKNSQRLRCAVAMMMEKMPEAIDESEEAKLLRSFGDHKVYSIVHLIYQAQQYEGDSKDYEFSRLSMEEHWRAGYNATIRTLRHPQALARPHNYDGVATFDINEHQGE